MNLPPPCGWGFCIFIGLVSGAFGGFGIWSLKTGKTRLRDRTWVTRAERPFDFWTNVVILLMVSVGMISMVIYAILKPN